MTQDEQKISDGIFRYFGQEWARDIRAAISKRPEVAQDEVVVLLTKAYMCGVRDGDGFGIRSLAQEADRMTAESAGSG